MTKINPLVSVIIPTYNRPHIVLDAINSALNQTYRNLEIIVVNDGGDRELEFTLRKEFGHKINYIYKKNGGLSSARNYGIKATKGQYISFLDDDDIWYPEFLEKMLAVFHKNSDIGMAYSGWRKVDNNSKVLKFIEPHLKGKIWRSITNGNFAPVHAIVLKKKCIDQCGYFDESLTALEDWDMWLCITHMYSVDCVKEPLVEYRLGNDNMSFDQIEWFRIP